MNTKLARQGQRIKPIQIRWWVVRDFDSIVWELGLVSTFLCCDQELILAMTIAHTKVATENLDILEWMDKIFEASGQN